MFGQPVKTSLSPVIHRRFADQFGLKIDYQLIETGAEGFPAALETFRQAGGAGCNITLPLKQDAWRLATLASEEVSLAQAANTLVYQHHQAGLPTRPTVRVCLPTCQKIMKSNYLTSVF